MSATLPLARAAFIKAVNRDTINTERTRLLAVLDAVIAWSDAHPAIRFRADPNEKGVVRFECVDTKAVFWAATPRRYDAPVLELLPGASRFLTEEERASVVGTLNAHTREDLDPAGRLHISFGALKNTAAQAAVLELMDGLLAKTQPAGRAAVQVS